MYKQKLGISDIDRLTELIHTYPGTLLGRLVISVYTLTAERLPKSLYLQAEVITKNCSRRPLLNFW